MSEEIWYDVQDGVATVTMNRPERRNALSSAVLQGMHRIFAELEAHRDVRVVVIRGEGPVFCSGMDLKEMRERGGARDPDADITGVLHRIEALRHPVVAAIQGDALAGGCELALHCDLRVAAENARFGMPLARIGLVVPFVLGQKLVEVIGPAHTRQILLTGQPITARRAYEIGMVTQVVAREELDDAVAALTRSIAANAPLSLMGMKRVVQRAAAVREGIAHDDLDAFAADVRRSADAREGVAAQLERRPPVWRGE